jgi:hypothetical protein
MARGASSAAIVILGVVLSATAAASPFQSRVRPLLQQYCFGCHEGDQAEGGITLEAYREADAKTVDRGIWQKVLRQLEGRAMPPADAEQPAPDDMQEMISWLKNEALKPDCSQGERPGRVTVRRLNREEYNNTVRDLLHVSVRPADNFPSDDIGFGFDTIGDVLTLPPVLLERYIDAADTVARAAIASTDIDVAPADSLPGGVLATNGDLDREFTVDSEGDYAIRVSVWGDQAGPEPPLMTIAVDGSQQRKLQVPNERSSPEEHEIRIRLPAGNHTVRITFHNDFYDAKVKKRKDRNLHIGGITIVGPIGVLPTELPESHTRFFTRPIPIDADIHDQTDVFIKLIRPLASRAFRRRATENEIEGLSLVFFGARDRGETVERATQMAIAAMLVSPSFLFRTEASPPPGVIRTLSDFEIASRLSYFLWSSMPDNELFRAAVRGELGSAEQVVAQARRMLGDPKAAALAKNFGGQWLGLRGLDEIDPDPELFPTFDAALREAIRRETELFFEHVVREDQSILEFLDADYTFVNGRLAQHYEIAGITGEAFQKVSLDPRQRGGLLGHASILAVTSNPTRTSPVKRGKWILENLFAAPPPEPPANVPELADGKSDQLTGTLRQRMEQHRADPACATCHKLMDPIGFGLENYDAIGGWRTRDGDAEVDASGELPDGRDFQGPGELRSLLAQRKDEFRRCFIEKMLTYGLGRGLEYYDACAVERIAAASAAADDRISVVIAEIVTSPAFRQIESGGGKP